jgi:hypothetical protein
MQTDAMHAVDKVPVQGVNGGRGHCVGRRVARMADNVLSVGLSQHRRADEEVEGESHREVLRVGKGKEGFVREMRISVRQATPEAEGPTAGATIKQAGTAGGSGVERVEETKESARSYHCRGCLLGVWVASSIKAIQVIEEGG